MNRFCELVQTIHQKDHYYSARFIVESCDSAANLICHIKALYFPFYIYQTEQMKGQYITKL